jgi:hypothetical protein
VQPFAIIEEKAYFGHRKMVRENTSGNFVPISGELARTWTLANRVEPVST